MEIETEITHILTLTVYELVLLKICVKFALENDIELNKPYTESELHNFLNLLNSRIMFIANMKRSQDET